MKIFVCVLVFLFPLFLEAQDQSYPWYLTGFGGGASLCDEQGCFGPSGYSLGGSFGRPMSERWSFELEAAYARTSEDLPPRVDLVTGIIFTPQLERSRVWGGGTFFAKLSEFGSSNDFFIAIGFIGAFERQREKAPEGIFHAPTKDLGIKAGAAGGAGMNYRFSENWGIRPEVRFYASPDLSGLRYTVGISRKL